MTRTATLDEALEFIYSSAEAADIPALITAINSRQRTLADRRAAAVTDGMHVQVTGISPKVLNGLVGTARATANGNRFDVVLDRDHLAGSGKMHNPAVRRRTTTHGDSIVLVGVPAACLSELA